MPIAAVDDLAVRLLMADDSKATPCACWDEFSEGDGAVSDGEDRRTGVGVPIRAVVVQVSAGMIGG